MRTILLFLFLVLMPISANTDEPVWTEPGEEGARVHLFLFWSKNCAHCLEVRPLVVDLAQQHAWIELHDHELSEHSDNVRRFVAMVELLGQQAQAVPTLVYCRQMEVGLDSSREGLAGFFSRPEECRWRKGESAEHRLSVPPLAIPLLGEIDSGRLSLPLLTVLIAAMDAFNPCAFFVLLFLLSLLVNQQDRRRMLLIGVVFVVFSGLMYFAFMAAWLNLFLVLGSLPWVTGVSGILALAIGLINVKDFVRFRQGITLSIPADGKVDIFQRARLLLGADKLAAMLGATVILAISANFYELLCTAGFPMVFTRLLTLQEGSALWYYLYLGLYNVIYVLPLLAIVLAFVRTMGARKLSEREGRSLKLLSGLMMLGLGTVLLLAPEMLGKVWLALAVPALAIAITWIAARWIRG